jgi:hypothetical protein
LLKWENQLNFTHSPTNIPSVKNSKFLMFVQRSGHISRDYSSETTALMKKVAFRR